MKSINKQIQGEELFVGIDQGGSLLTIYRNLGKC
jgi:hypothetical protein